MDESIWICEVCDQENLSDARYCEACGEIRGARANPLRQLLKGPLGSIRDTVDRLRALRNPPPPVESDDAEAAAVLPEGPEDTDVDSEHPELDRARKRVRVRFLHLSDRLKGAFTKESYREVLKDRSNPATTMLIAFVAWGIFRMVGFVPLMILLRILSFIMGPFGLVLTLACAYVYSQHQEEIDQRVGTMRRRARAFASVTREAARSIGWLRGKIRDVSQPGVPPGEAVPGAAVKITDEEDEEWPRPKPTRG